MRDRGASPNVRHSTLIVTDEHQTLGDDGQDVLQWVQEEKIEKNKSFASIVALPNIDSER